MGRSGAGVETSEVQCNRVLLFLWVLCLWLYPFCPVWAFNHERPREDGALFRGPMRSIY